MLRRCKGISVLVVHSEQAEIPGVTREHPVVRIRAELTDGARRCTHQAYVVVFDGGQQEELVVIEKWNHLVREVWVVQFFGFNQGRLYFFEFIFGVHQGIGHIFHIDQLLYKQPWVFQLLVHRTRPEAVFEEVVLHRALLLDLAVPTVVVGQDESFGRNEFSRTETTKTYNGIFQGAVVYAVNVLGTELATHRLHLCDVIVQEHGDPHALLRS